MAHRIGADGSIFCDDVRHRIYSQYAYENNMVSCLYFCSCHYTDRRLYALEP